jgi:copper chaperone CopZ
MKKFIVTLFAFTAIGFATYSQTKPVGKAVFNTPQVQCEECKTYLEERMIREYGITSVNANYQRKTTTVTWLTDRTTAENIKVIFSYLGFDADDVTADEIAFKKLPPCCKKTPAAPKIIPKVDTPTPIPVLIKPVVKVPVAPIPKADSPKIKPVQKINKPKKKA